MSEPKINLKEFAQRTSDITVATQLLRTDEVAIQRWIDSLATELEAFHVQVSLLNPRVPLTVGHFKFLNQMKDRIVAKLDLETLETLGLNQKIERMALRRWLVASGLFLEGIGNHTIAGPFATSASKSESSVNNAV